jgi:hypothetical protein
MLRPLRKLPVLILMALVLGLFPLPVSAADSHFFPETGQTSSNAFYEFWLSHGQTAVLGFPVSPTFRASTDDSPPNTVVQSYERVVMEWHPENPVGARVQLTRLAVKRLDQYVEGYRANSPETPDIRTFAPRSCHTGSDCQTFDATHHTVLGAFRDFWNANGGLPIFGYPLTEEFTVKDAATGHAVAIQYFERAIFEFHPEIDGGVILLERLGAELWDYYSEDTLAHPEWFVTVPDATSNAPYLPATP